MTALWVILSVLGVLFILLIIPVRVVLLYVAQPQITLHYLFFKLQILPDKEQKKPTKKKVPQVKKSKEQDTVMDKLRALIKKKGAAGFLQLVKEALQLFAGFTKNILRHLHIQRLDICFVAGAENAGDAALEYGEVCAVLYPSVAALHSICPIKKLGVVVDVDYLAEKSAVVADCCLWIQPLFVINEVLRLAWKGLCLLIRLR